MLFGIVQKALSSLNQYLRILDVFITFRTYLRLECNSAGCTLASDMVLGTVTKKNIRCKKVIALLFDDLKGWVEQSN